MIFFKSLLFGLMSSVLFFSLSHAAFNDVGTAYSNTGTEKFVQDTAGDGLTMINAFVCIVQNSNAGTRPNATWRVLVDEIKCGLKQAGDGDSGALSLADATLVSTRATSGSNQEVTAYFASTSGSNYITDMVFNASGTSAFGLTMDFRWYQASDNTTPVDQATMSNGWSDISVSDNDSDGNLDTIIGHTEWSPSDNFRSGTHAVSYGPSNNVTAFVSSNMDNEDGNKVFYRGITSSTNYRRFKYNAAEVLVADKCYDRSKQWANTHAYGLFDNVTGAEIAVSGSFGFTYSSGAKRGYMGHWGAWLEGGSSDYPAGSSTVAITQENTAAAMTLNSASGRLTKITKSSVTLVDGERFKIWDGAGETDVYYRSSCGTGNFSTSATSCSVYTFGGSHYNSGAQVSAGDWLYSEMARAEIVVQSGTQALMFKRTNVTPSTTSPNIASDLALTCVGWCPKAKPTKANFEASPRVVDGFCQAPFGSGKNGPSASGCTYTFKKLTDATAPMTMYKGSDPVVPYNNAGTAELTEGDAGYNYHIGGGRYIFTSDISGTCAANPDPSATNNIWNCTNGVLQWESGINRWNKMYYAKYTDNSSIVTIDQPTALTYTFATADDQNTDFTSASPFNFTWKKRSQSAGVYARGFDNVSATDYPSQYDNKTFNLEYEGSGQLRGFPEKKTENDWLRLVNPVSGTQVVNADNASKGYVLKALETGMMFNEVAASNCASMTMPAGFAISNIPTEVDRTSSTALWGQRPLVTTISVKQGEEQ